MKAISIGGAYAYLICTGLQTYESRTWAPSNLQVGEVVAIHVPTSKEWDDTFKGWGIDPALCPKGSVIGYAVYAGCEDGGDGFYRHYFDSPSLFPVPVMGVKGARRYWEWNGRVYCDPPPPQRLDSPMDCAIFSAQLDQVSDFLSGREQVFFSQHELEYPKEIALFYAAPYGRHEADVRERIAQAYPGQDFPTEAFYGRARITGKGIITPGKFLSPDGSLDGRVAMEAFSRQKERLGWEVGFAYSVADPVFFPKHFIGPGYGDPTLGDCWTPGSIDELKACKQMLG